MAIRGVSAVGPQDEVQTKKAKKGGGEWGAALGTVAGGVIGGLAGGAAAVATGGAATPAIAAGAMGGAAAGGGLGRQLGEWVSPSRAESTAVTRRMQSQGPQTMDSGASEKLKQSIMALQTQPPEIRQEYAKPLVDAYMTSVAKTGVA